MKLQKKMYSSVTFAEKPVDNLWVLQHFEEMGKIRRWINFIGS
jgi:hypothetical protein